MISIFQTSSGAWHIPSILMASSWAVGTILTGIFMFANLRVNRNDRMRAFEKEQQSISEAREARTKITALELMTKSRRLSAEQSATLAKMALVIASTIGRVDVTAANGNGEAQEYAMDFVRSFREAGWQSDLALPIPGLMPDVKGIHIAIRGVDKMPIEAVEVSKMLTTIGASFTVSLMKPDFFPGSSFVLVIGGK